MQRAPIDVACGFCAQQPSEPCINLEDGTPFLVDGKPGFHAERIDIANFVSSDGAGYTPSEAQYDDAVLKTGLVE